MIFISICVTTVGPAREKGRERGEWGERREEVKVARREERGESREEEEERDPRHRDDHARSDPTHTIETRLHATHSNLRVSRLEIVPWRGM